MTDPNHEPHPIAVTPSRWHPLRILAALAIAALSFLPLANWIPGGYSDPDFAVLRDEWVSGTAVVLGVGVVLAILSRRIPPLWREGLATRLGDALWRHWTAYAFALALVVLVLSAIAATTIFVRRPSLIDEIAQLFQARIYAQGRLALPVGDHPEFFSTLHTVTREGKVFSQFPPGGPAMLALGVLAGAPWLVGPIAGALSVLLWAWCLRNAEPNPRVAALALALFALSPFAVFMSGTYMNHVTVLLWLNVTCAALAALTARDGVGRGVPDRVGRVGADGHASTHAAAPMGTESMTAERPPDATLKSGAAATALAAELPGDVPAAPPLPVRPWLGFLVGLGLGVAATIRPVDALAFAIPAGLWMLIRALRAPRRWAEAIPSGIGVALPILAMMWVHVHTTGRPLLFGYELLWGKEHGLGFHMAPWGIAHTPARGVELLNLYGTYMQAFLFETSLPGLIPFVVALALVPRLRPFDRFLLAGGVLLALAYFAYWHNGFFLGPRFLFPLVTVLTWWTARAIPIVASRVRAFRPGSLGYRTATWTLLAAVGLALLASLPAQADLYSRRFRTERWDVAAAARAKGIDSALVLVPETWESQFAVRMRALGVTAQAAEKTYRAVDACRLENALLDLERRGVRGESATRELFALLADSARVQRVELRSQANVRVRQGSNWTPRCLRILGENERGAIALAPFLHTPVPGLVFARDLHERDTVLLRMYPGRPVWVLRSDDGTLSGTPVLHPAPVDSLLQAWAALR